jgi:signal peptidase II
MKFTEIMDKQPKNLSGKIAILLAFIIVLTGTDLIVKEIAHRNLQNKPDVVVINGIWSYHYVVNDDIGFSILRDITQNLQPGHKWLLIVLLQGAGTIVVISFYFYSKTLKYLVPLSFIVSGALGNLTDRIIRGHVVDYVMWHYYEKFIWPIFNLADVFTITGAVMLFIVLLFFSKEENSLKQES